MGLFHKLTFFEALEILDCDSLSAQQKKKIIKAESHFTEDEKSACYMLFCLHQGDCGRALYFINRTQQGEKLSGVMMAALYTHIAFRKFSEAHEEDPSYPDYIAYLALAYEHGFFGCEKDHSKAVETVEPLRSSEATGALAKQALKDIFPEGADSDASDNKSADTPESKKANAAATADTESTSPVVPSEAKGSSDKSAPQAEFKRIEYDGGDVYEGYFLNEKKNGHGKYIWANGDAFDGNWVDGKRTGKGKVTWSNGASFDGEWKDNQMYEGKYTFPDGEIYDGSFQNGKKEGYGKQVFPNGEKYEGQWHDGKKHGRGTYTWADGDTYEGDWKDGKRCGRGKLIQYGKVPATGETYVKRSYDGEWLDSKEHGHGICVEGDFGMEKMDKVFEGEWVNGKRQGRFVWYYTNSKGGRYMDFYEDGKLVETCIPYDESIKTVADARRAKALADGKSSSTTPVYTNSSPAATQESDDNGGDETEESDTGDNVLLRYQNGDSYRGAAVGGVREGFGAYFYADDGYYRGTFHQGVFHGYGIREYGNGHTYKGMWKNDTKNGYGEYTFADGRSYFGWWKDDCFQGFGCMTLSGGEVYVGEYENHKENGIILYNRGNKWSGYKAADGKVIGSSAGRWTAYKDGSEYCGPIIERRRGNTIYRVKEGFGEYCFPDDDSECPSDRYLGQFKDDMPYGTGIRLYTSPETDMPIIMASNDFRGDIIPRGHFQSVCGIKDPSGNCDFFLYYVGECKDSVCYGRGVMYVIGTTERSRYTPYGVKGGSIIYCDTFREHPDGPATVINRYGEELHGRFVDGMFEQYK